MNELNPKFEDPKPKIQMAPPTGSKLSCLILGGAGFIGSHIVDALVGEGHYVRVFELPHSNTENLIHLTESIEMVFGDFSNMTDISSALDGMDVVVHLAGSILPGPSNKNPTYDVETTVIGTLNLLEKAVQEGVSKVVYASSGGTVYGIPNILPIPETHPTVPLCSYGITKLTVEKYLELFRHIHGLEYTVLRISNPYGERQRMDNIQGAIAVFLGRVLTGQPITIWGDGLVARDYLHISDLARAFLKVIEHDTRERIYNIGSGHAYSLKEIVNVIKHITGQNLCVEYADARKLDVPINCLDIRLAIRDLPWHPVISLEEGITQTWEWLRNYGMEPNFDQLQRVWRTPPCASPTLR